MNTCPASDPTSPTRIRACNCTTQRPAPHHRIGYESTGPALPSPLSMTVRLAEDTEFGHRGTRLGGDAESGCPAARLPGCPLGGEADAGHGGGLSQVKV